MASVPARGPRAGCAAALWPGGAVAEPGLAPTPAGHGRHCSAAAARELGSAAVDWNSRARSHTATIEKRRQEAKVRKDYGESWGLGHALAREAAEDQRGVGAAEAERVRQRDIDIALARLVRHQVDRGFDRRVVEVDGGRGDPVADRQDREDRLDRAGGAEQMADAGFGRRHGNLAGGIADQALHRAELDLVAERRRGAVRIDVDLVVAVS